jgi:hypothetical protein
MNNKQLDIVKFVTLSNWIIFFIFGAVGFTVFADDFAIGIIVGGFIVIINFHLLAKTLKKALAPPEIASHKVILAKYYIRFIISGLIIFLLIITHYINPLGLLVGLSVVVASIFIATLRELTNLILKEAV